MRALLFLAFPFIELFLLIKAGAWLGALPVLCWVCFSIVLGIWTIRERGQTVMFRARACPTAENAPQPPVLEGMLFFCGGILLILPGILSDIAGLFLLFPPTRRLAAALLSRRLGAERAASGQGMSRIVFFRSFGFPGFDGRFGGSASSGDARGAGEAYRQEPRQAVVIESEAIAVHREDAEERKG